MDRVSEEMRRSYSYHEILEIIWKRLNDLPHPRHILKSLILIEYLLRNGPERFISDAKFRHEEVLRATQYTFIKSGSDVASEVRVKAAAVIGLLDNPEELREAREAARRARGRILGISHEYEAPRLAIEGDRDPFAAWRAASPDIDYKALGKDGVRAMSVETERESREEGEEPVFEAKKKSKGKKKGKKSKKSSRRASEEETKEDEAFVSNEEPDFFEAQMSPVQSHAAKAKAAASGDDSFDSFAFGISGPVVSSVLAAPPAYQVGPASMEDIWAPLGDTRDDRALALFDSVDNTSKPAEGIRSEDFLLFAASTESASVVAPAESSAPVDSWDSTLQELTNIDNLNVTAEELRWKKAQADKKSRLASGPTLRQMLPAKEENSFPVFAPAPGASGSMSVVPSGYYDGSMGMQPYALVPYNAGGYPAPSGLVPHPYGYGAPAPASGFPWY